MTFTAKGHVHVLTSNHCLAVLASCTEREARILFAKLADGAELFDFLALWDKVQDIWERSS